MWWLTFAGVFERFPGLKLMITETPGHWFTSLAAELDATWNMFSHQPQLATAFFEQVPNKPSDYMRRNVFLGASFASPFEAKQAVADGFSSQFMWGSDYPHVEGTFLHPTDPTMPSVTRLSLRNTFCDMDPVDIRSMLGGNAVEVYGLDADALQKVARDIAAPTVEEITTPIDAVPEGASLHAFRSGETGWS